MSRVKIILIISLMILSKANIAFSLEGSLATGDKIANFTLPSISGSNVTLYDLLKEKNVVLTFYRGGWCPICNIQLQDYQSNITLHNLNAILVAISPETIPNAKETAGNNQLMFHVLVDHDNVLARKLGILWEIPNLDRAGFEKWLQESTGKTLQEFNGQETYNLPIPATFVINQDGIVTYSFKDINYKNRAKAEDIITALKAIK